MEIIHDPGRGVFLVKVVFRDSYKLKLRNTLFATVENTYPTRANSCTVEPQLSGLSVVASQSARCLKVPSSHLWTEKDRVHLTRTSDTSCMIEGDSDDERKTRVHLILGSRKTLMSTMPRECWNCRVYHWTAEQNSFKRLARRIRC